VTGSIFSEKNSRCTKEFMNDMTCFMAEPSTGQINRHDYVDIRPLPAAASGVDLAALTPRQQETLRLLAEGFYYKEIGVALGISHATVRAHLHAVYRKLNVNSRARAVIVFHEHARHQLARNAGRRGAAANLKFYEAEKKSVPGLHAD
jgi:DNA-binding CsgD family transcriptional regulator